MNIYQDVSEKLLTGGSTGAVAGWAREILTQVAEGCLAIRAVRHPLGFVCLPVIRAGWLGVCVHLWSGEVRRIGLTTGPIHAHSWDLVSHVLYGTLRNDMVRVLDDPVTPTHRVFEVHSTGSGDEIRGTARLVRFEVCATATNSAGDSYRVPAGEFHLSALPDCEVATVVLGRSLPGAVDLALGPIQTPTHLVSRERYDEAQTRHLARTAADHRALKNSSEPGEPWRPR